MLEVKTHREAYHSKHPQPYKIHIRTTRGKHLYNTREGRASKQQYIHTRGPTPQRLSSPRHQQFSNPSRHALPLPLLLVPLTLPYIFIRVTEVLIVLIERILFIYLYTVWTQRRKRVSCSCCTSNRVVQASTMCGHVMGAVINSCGWELHTAVGARC